MVGVFPHEDDELIHRIDYHQSVSVPGEELPNDLKVVDVSSCGCSFTEGDRAADQAIRDIVAELLGPFAAKPTVLEENDTGGLFADCVDDRY